MQTTFTASRRRGRKAVLISLLCALFSAGLVSLGTTSASAGDGSAQLSLPWAAGESMTIWPSGTNKGFHSFDGPLTPTSSFDFAGTAKVRAAAGGIVRRDQAQCPGVGWVRIDHLNGWQTTYHHLRNMPASLTEGSTIARGDILGDTGETTPCGGTADGNHVHFTVWKPSGAFSWASPAKINNQANLVGLDIGGWNIGWDSAQQTKACLTRFSDGLKRCMNQAVPSDGKIGSGGTGTGQGTRLLGNVDGDSQNKADAVVMFRDSGTAMVATSNGIGFNTPQTWSSDPQMAGATKYFLGDVTGDGKSDLIGFWNTGGVWKVVPSNGSGFLGNPTPFASGHGVNTTKQWISDVNGDGKADVVTFDGGSGDWYASLSSGSGFWSPVRWSLGHGVGSSDQVVADFTGDSKADLGIYVASNGNWYVAVSGTTPPFGYGPWAAGHGIGSNKRLAGDVNGDGRADEAFFTASNGAWHNGLSTGTGFSATSPWAIGHGVNTTEQFLSDVNGDSKADMITFDAGSGDWYASLSSGSGFWSPNRWVQGHGAGS